MEVSQIVYNLAFSPKIHHIDLTNCLKVKDAVEPIFKLLKISGSMRTLLLGGSNIAERVTKDFC